MQAPVPCVEWEEGFVQKAGVGEIGVTSRNGGRGGWRPRGQRGRRGQGTAGCRAERNRWRFAVPAPVRGGRLVGLYFTS
jgi:hypothetical protein